MRAHHVAEIERVNAKLQEANRLLKIELVRLKRLADKVGATDAKTKVPTRPTPKLIDMGRVE